MINVACVLTCHNRKVKTLRCLNSMLEQSCTYNLDVDYYICDDNSTDGTSEAVQSCCTKAVVVHGTGDLFWARGMAKALEAIEDINSYDFLLMINDDVEFTDKMMQIMFDSFYMKRDKLCAIVGSTKDKNTGKHTYGGLLWNWKAMPEIATPVLPDSSCPICNQTNWNCFLIPVPLYQKIGKIDSRYEHSKADFDYSNRITKEGYKIYVAFDYIGYCSRNDLNNTWRDRNLSIRERLKLLEKKTGSPWRSRWLYCKKYYGVWACYKFVLPYVHIIKSGIFKK